MNKHRFIFLLLLAFWWVMPAWATTAPTVDGLAQIPIQHEGRVKPFYSFAYNELYQLTGQKTWQGQGAVSWLAYTLFQPQRAIGEPFIQIKNSLLRKQLALTDTPHHRYSVMQITAAFAAQGELINSILEADPKTLTPNQTALLEIYTKASRYLELLGSFAMILPLSEQGPALGNADRQKIETQTTFLDLAKQTAQISQQVKTLVRKKGDDLDRYTQAELSLLQLGMRLDYLKTVAARSQILRIVPPQWSGNNSSPEWQSPWAIIQNGTGSPQTITYIHSWRSLADAYRAGDGAATQTAIQSVQHQAAVLAQNDPAFPAVWRLGLEYIYYHYQPVMLTELFYGFALLSLCALLVFNKPVIIPRFAMGFYLCAFILHVFSILSRILILGRPPVGTLYESVLFVSLIISAAGFFVLRAQQFLYAAAAIVGAVGLLLLAPSFHAGGDSLSVLAAVLDTNFWLATHVICITAAYGVCIVTALYAHVILGQHSLGRPIAENHEKIQHRLLLVGLLLTAVGTVLGGIWADQSWGRFWGWDPKENGALLIVLWIAWVLHGRMSGDIKGVFFTAANAALAIIVALSWFGVNLLNVGLHSYGFISGMAWGLGLFCAAELSFIAWAVYRIQHHQKKEVIHAP